MRRLITGEATPDHGRSRPPRIAADECSGAAAVRYGRHGTDLPNSGPAAAPGATALAMVLPQELHHFS
jgi:hypothetical protein